MIGTTEVGRTEQEVKSSSNMLVNNTFDMDPLGASSALKRSSAGSRKRLVLSIDIPQSVCFIERIGGNHILENLVDSFYAKVMADSRLCTFFDGEESIYRLKSHQYELIKYSFSKETTNPNTTCWGLREAHGELFAKGLNESHFDVLMEHFRKSLVELNVSQGLVEEAISLMNPLRQVFQEEAAKHNQGYERPMCMGMMMAELNSPASQSTQTLFNRLGGKDAVVAAVDQFYQRVITDDRVNYFFEGVNMHRLKSHQFDFMRYVFSRGQYPHNGKGIKEAHQRLFAKGLNESHFQIIAEHFVDTLKALGVNQELIDEAAAAAFFPFT